MGQLGDVGMQVCIGCGEAVILLACKTYVGDIQRKDFPMICSNCNPKRYIKKGKEFIEDENGTHKLDVPLNQDLSASQLALVKCKDCGNIVAIIEAGITKDKKEVKSKRTYTGVCSKCLDSPDKIIVNLNTLYNPIS